MEEKSQPKWEGKASEELTVTTAEQVWPLLEDFCNLHKWLHSIDTCYQVDGIPGQPGLIRYAASTVTSSSGGREETTINWAKEKLLVIDPIKRRLVYEVIDNNIGMKSYVATMEVLPINGADGKHGCKIEWSYVSDPIEGWRFEMGTLQLSSSALSSFSVPFNFNYITNSHKTLKLAKHLSFSKPAAKRLGFSRGKIRAIGTIPEGDSEVEEEEEEPPFVAFTFVSSVLLPDGTPDIHFRKACGGQTLRRIMLDTNMELYGPYARPLLNCAGGGTCGTCLVEIVGGKELLTPRTKKETEKLKKKPKNYRLACQATVGKPDSIGMVVVQQLPEWKAHEWNYEKIAAAELESQLESS